MPEISMWMVLICIFGVLVLGLLAAGFGFVVWLCREIGIWVSNENDRRVR